MIVIMMDDDYKRTNRIFLCRTFTLKYGTVLSIQSLSDSVLGNARWSSIYSDDSDNDDDYDEAQSIDDSDNDDGVWFNEHCVEWYLSDNRYEYRKIVNSYLSSIFLYSYLLSDKYPSSQCSLYQHHHHHHCHYLDRWIDISICWRCLYGILTHATPINSPSHELGCECMSQRRKEGYRPRSWHIYLSVVW